MCPQEHLSHISNTLGLSFELKRIGPLVAALVYLLALFLSAVSNTTKNLSASFYSEILIQITCQHLLFLVAFATLIYRKYCDTPPILVGHHCATNPSCLKASLIEENTRLKAQLDKGLIRLQHIYNF